MIDEELERTALGQLMIAAALIATDTHNTAVGVIPADALIRHGSGSRLDYAGDQSEHGRRPPPAGSPQ